MRSSLLASVFYPENVLKYDLLKEYILDLGPELVHFFVCFVITSESLTIEMTMT